MACRTRGELGTLMGEVTRALGFRYFALLHHASLQLPSAAHLARLDNYPPAWTETLRSEGLAADDPVHRASARTHIGFAWEQLSEIAPLKARHRAILDRSTDFGLGTGFTVPVNIPGEPSGSCSFATGTGDAFPDERLLCAQLVGQRAFETARRLVGRPGPLSPVQLSPRQRQCLRLLAAGKTDWEIARILGLGVETVRQYVKSARAAYDVVSRSQLVAHGLRDAWISFEDAIPPSG